MTRIVCRQPSTGKPINIRLEGVDINWTTIAEAPDFSVPDPSGATYTSRDDPDTSRGIAAGEIFFLTPLVAKNKTGSNATISVRFLPEDTVATNDAIGDILVPSGQSVAIPIQGRSLVKRVATSTYGDRLQVKSSVSGAFDIWASVNEQASAEHVGVV